ncbi:MAG: hypothetical protein FWH16_02985 [Oscillospiraceae bacterium]|nr:hypothetical protein [Oscillospiraceae bacterium]
MDVVDIYRAMRRRATRYVSEHGEDEWGGTLPVLEVILPNLNELSTVTLGVIDVPIKRVCGTVAAGRSPAFAGNFSPILPDDSEFAKKWEKLFTIHESEGIHDACIGLEYLGKYYIIEGHKRVSVLKSVKAPSVLIDVRRVIPDDSADSPDARVYKEFLSVDTRISLRGMWFSAYGGFTELYGAAKRIDAHNTEDVLFDAFYTFRMVYHDLGLGSQPATTGDAFLAFSRVYGLPHNISREELSRNIQTLEKRFSFIYSPQPLKTMHTFYGKYRRTSLILGALAGSFSQTGRIGWGAGAFGGDTPDYFIEGAKMTNTNINVFGPDFTGHDADVALLPYSDGGRGPGFPGVFARLAGLTVPHGYISEYYAAVSRDFGAFYASADPSLPDLYSAGSQPEHLELGLDTGFLRLHLNMPVLSPQTLKLVEILKTANG